MTMSTKRILIGCEFSGTVRDAFSRKGWDAWSCDIIPTESEQTKSEGKHIQDDVLKHLCDGWDMMIAHPPCTYLSYAGMRSWNEKGRIQKRLESLKFFAELWEAPIDKICLENPVSCASPVIAKYSQIIHPYYFGDPYLKRTCLWLKNLPLLTYSDEHLLFEQKTTVQATGYHVNSSSWRKIKPTLTAGTSNQKERSRFWHGIAEAMAEQWTLYFNN
jgi:hypothetical protein